MDPQLKLVKDFWEDASCGERLYLNKRTKEGYQEQSRIRYELEPMILEFAEFGKHCGKKVLEIGIGLGSDHQKWAEGRVILWGTDITERAVARTRERFNLFGLHSNLQVADAEKLPFGRESFDVVYSWGVLMYAPSTEKAIDEIYRVLKPGGAVLLMLYHYHSVVGYMLWTRYALMRLRPWMPLREIYNKYLESPGTKAFTIGEVKTMMKMFEKLEIKTHLTHCDLLVSDVGQRHRGFWLTFARLIWPRPLIQKFFPKHGLFMTIKGIKPKG